MASFVLELRVDDTTRVAQRRRVVEAWLAEAAGTTAERHTYRYNVETLQNGARIYVKRPARLNKGMDFVIYSEGWLKNKTNPNDKPPKHLNLFEAIAEVTKDASGKVDKKKLDAIHAAIRRVWECESPDAVIASSPTLRGNLVAERVLKLAKWFFIEQDLTYWTESGREMLMHGIDAHVLKLRTK